jgi:hypothetical protein
MIQAQKLQDEPKILYYGYFFRIFETLKMGVKQQNNQSI